MPKKIYQDSNKKVKNPLVKKVWESKIKQSPSKNVHISYSSFSTYTKCPKLWDLQYRQKVVPFRQSVYTIFGTAMHETIQTWLEVMYYDKVKTATDMNLDSVLYDNIVKAYKGAKAINGSDPIEGTFPQKNELDQSTLTQFYNDGKQILDFISKKRSAYFSTKNMKLAGIETLLYQDIKPGVKFKGLVDLVFYHPNSDRWTIMDIKTSTRGWNDKAKKNPNLTAQVVLYKEYFSKQFGIDKENIDVEFFILKRQVPKNAEFASMQKRVQTFSPSSGPRTTKKLLESLNKFIDDVIDENGMFKDKEYKCSSAFGECEHCSGFLTNSDRAFKPILG